MNRREKELLQRQLENEKLILKRLKRLYEQAFVDVDNRIMQLMADELIQSKIYRIEYQKALREQLAVIVEKLADNQYKSISEYLKDCYEDGFIGTLYDLQGQGVPLIIPMNQEDVTQAVMLDSQISEGLYTNLGNNVDKLKSTISSEISRGFATAIPYAEIARNIRNNADMSINQSMRIVRTEGNRIRSKSTLDVSRRVRDKGIDLVKVWDSTLDGKTRPHHRKLDGQVREVDEYFEVPDGRGHIIKALAPLHFGIASEDIHCRCVLLLKPRWDVDGRFTKLDNKTGKLLEFENVKDYEDFKKKYWKKVRKTVDKSGESGIINTRAISGALNPYSKAAEVHAEQYYESVRHMKTDVKRIAKNTGFNEYDIYKIKEHVFLKKHDLGGSELEYFYPSYEMAQSWQRLIDGKNIKKHDITLLQHEIMERNLMEQGYSQLDAHKITEKKYNYGKEANEYYAETNKHSKK